MSDNLGFPDNSIGHDLGIDPSSRTPVRPAATSAAVAPPRRKPVFAGYTAGQLAIGAAILFALVWAMWVTRTVTADKPQRIVKVQLSRIVGEYVQAQARSATPPDQVQAQMTAFLASVDAEVQRRGADGQIIMVGEAVLNKDVPDITAEVAKAVYASGLKVPTPATPTQMGAMMQGQVPTAPAIAPVAATPQGLTPSTVMQAPFAAPAPATAAEVAAPQGEAAGASVATFGGAGVQ
jgi:hypothetical protein